MTTIYDFTLFAPDAEPLSLAQFKGKAILLVNTASKCGFTPQYSELEKLWLEMGHKGLVVIAVPSNDFGAQEPASNAEVLQFCQVNYGVTFPVAPKLHVKGAEADALYKWIKPQAGLLGSPKWNFHKFLFDRQGHYVDWFSSQTKPTGPKIKTAIEKILAP